MANPRLPSIFFYQASRVIAYTTGHTLILSYVLVYRTYLQKVDLVLKALRGGQLLD